MIDPAGMSTAAFGDATYGDARFDTHARAALSAELDISAEWAYIYQVHGTTVARAVKPGNCGEADIIITSVPGLPIAIATADCVPIVLWSQSAVGVVHAGWRGAAAGVVTTAVRAMEADGSVVERAAIGPAICHTSFEVGEDVRTMFPGFESSTDWGTPSVDLVGVVRSQLGVIPHVVEDVCTFEDEGYFSYRRNATTGRQVTVAWLPND
jgi:purine-nucleoside/S-methyl-5'-thioadenosine phosphorylase / adenosine deaminase